MSMVFGIHVGNTSACLASFKDGKIDVIANDLGDRITPTVVAVHEKEKIVGLPAKASLSRHSISTVIHNKQFLNESIMEQDLDKIINSTPYKTIRENEFIKYELKCGDKMYVSTPESIATCIYSKLYAIAGSSVRSESDLRAVLCVPLHFSQSSRQTVMRTAEEAGFEVLHIISEPASSVLAHGIGIHNPDDESCCLVYRLGGTSLDVTIIKVHAGMYAVTSTIHKMHLGGDQFTNILVEYFVGEYRQKWKLDPLESRRSMVKLNSAAETCKHVLSTMSTAHCFIESLCDGVDFSHNITRARFESIIAPVMQDYVQPVYDVLKQAGIDTDSINKVILCGGSVKIPKVQQTLVDLFQQAELLGGMNPDEVIAIGAAKQGSFLTKAVDPDCEFLAIEVPVISVPLYIKQSNKSELHCIISASTPVPVKRVRRFSINPGEKEVTFELYEKEKDLKRKFLGKVTLHDVQPTKHVSVEVAINSIGGVHTVLANDLNKKISLKLEPPEI